jgi:hypothetical protein
LLSLYVLDSDILQWASLEFSQRQCFGRWICSYSHLKRKKKFLLSLAHEIGVIFITALSNITRVDMV